MPLPPDELLALALSRPAEALRVARDVLASRPSAFEASVAHQACGLVLRDFGDIDEAVRELRTARRYAQKAGDPDREADVMASLGVALVHAGFTRRGLSALDAAVNRSVDKELLGRILIKRVNALLVLGRYDEALADAQEAVALTSAAQHPLWEARALTHRAAAYLGVGAVARADRDYARTEALFAEVGQEVEYASTRHERGIATFASGDVPTALAQLDDAQRRFRDLGAFEPELYVNRCTVLLAAGLSRDALADIDAAVARIEQLRGSATRRAELLLCAALAAYAADDFAGAAQRSVDALKLFRRQHRPWWTARAELVLLQARFAGDGDQSESSLRRAQRVAAELDELDSTRATEAHLLAGRLALARGEADVALPHLRSAAHARSRGLWTSSTGWLAQAMLCEGEARWRGMLAACDRGLHDVHVYLRTLGATELRVLATARGSALAGLALRHAVRRWNARELLRWSERWRAVALAVAPVRPPRDEDLATDLAALRHLTLRLDADAPAHLHRERRRLETAVRQRVLRTPRASANATAPFQSTELLEHLGSTDLIELTDVDGELYAVVAGRNQVRMHHVGSMAKAEYSLARALFALRRDSERQRTRPLDMEAIGARLEADLLNDATRLLHNGPVVVIPTGRLHAVPWAMLPSLRDRPISVAPSASAWLRARQAGPPDDARIVLVGGPRLSTGTTEVRRLAQQYPNATVLAEGTASVDRVMAAIDGAWLVHIAAHSTFRADSPLFSAIELDDGPLTVYDLERLHRAPYRVVLSSCNSAVGAPTGADELLGMVSSLISLGAAGIVATVVPVDDPTTVPLMLSLHDHLSGGSPLPQALAMARHSAADDVVARTTAASFLAFGV
ncbi:CHAT domain-containing tetratricopeptide repeat protein [Kibdelosporangium philippinense]|uniref:CHAT domain-containing tetratricopeptide repeat protein n=1 Tax=Kibdelosporangium philippinense TaxID=211113 RepID=A0ABS8Z345_9PSEU|nr:CHAT domain-containing tetratricopeptide repeat protein [Kibdelosporangium philippinense]MCE7002356.1 CHAT domain-containing tetratricopeptide repeat protein [Kibdelosporangium philippinense]